MVSSSTYQLLATVVGTLLLSGCVENVAEIDRHPIALAQRSGALVTTATFNDEPAIPVTLDTLAPMTTIQSNSPGADADDTVSLADVRLFSADTAIPRARFPAAQTISTNLCDSEPCTVGLDEDTFAIEGILGANMLERTAAQIDFATHTLQFTPDAPGENRELDRLCQSVFTNVFSGGNDRVSVGQLETAVLSQRVAVSGCMHDVTPISNDNFVGIGVLLVVSTAMGRTLLSESAYSRYAEQFSAIPLFDLPEATLHIASGPTVVRLGQISRLALVGSAGDDSRGRGPCEEIQTNRAVTAFSTCIDPNTGNDRCLCRNRSRFCRAGAVLELDQTMDVAIVPDTDPILQGLRTAVRPRFAEVDGVLGIDVLSPSVLEFDYPNNRVIGTCNAPDFCRAFPAIRSSNDLEAIRACPTNAL